MTESCVPLMGDEKPPPNLNNADEHSDVPRAMSLVSPQK
jgi:hypothetical protein